MKQKTGTMEDVLKAICDPKSGSGQVLNITDIHHDENGEPVIHWKEFEANEKSPAGKRGS